MNKCSGSQVIGEMQIKTAVKFQLTLVITASENPNRVSAGEDVREVTQLVGMQASTTI